MTIMTKDAIIVDFVLRNGWKRREGELIFRYIYSFLECRKPFVRLWISSLTDKAIREGLQNLRPGEEYDLSLIHI